jgi:catechol 2,3-dioxygenase-like lactoylglutathione lyase family enzyme
VTVPPKRRLSAGVLSKISTRGSLSRRRRSLKRRDSRGSACRRIPVVASNARNAVAAEKTIAPIFSQALRSRGHGRSSGNIAARSRNQRYGHLIPRVLRTPVIFANRKNGRVALQRMDNVGIVVESLDAAISFFAELGLELEGRAMIEGDWSGRVTGLRDQRVEVAMMRTPDGHGRIELSRFLAPPVVADHRNAPVNALGYLRVMFAVDDLDDTLDRLREHGAQLVDEVVEYEDVYRLCYVRGPEGILIGLAEQIG